MASQNGDVRGAALGSERVRAALGSDGEFALAAALGPRLTDGERECAAIAREGETIEWSRTMRNRPYPVLSSAQEALAEVMVIKWMSEQPLARRRP